MCPVCLATALLIAGKVAATGGVAAIAIRKLGGRNSADHNSSPKILQPSLREPLPSGLVFRGPGTNVETENSK
jgi:hypothetical protein